MAQVCFYTFSWFKPIMWILRRWSDDFKWVVPIYHWRIFFFFITSEAALEWIFPKCKHIYEPISSQESPSIRLKISSKIQNPKCLVWAKRFKRVAFLEIIHHRNLSSLHPQDYACAFRSGDHRKHYTSLFSIYQI